MDRSQVVSERLEDMFSPDLFKGEVKFMEPMSSHTSLRIGGPAEFFVIPHDLTSLGNVILTLKKRGISFLALGGGTNMLVRDGGIEGVVISFQSFSRIEILREEEEFVTLLVEAGKPLKRLVSFTSEKGYSGMEGLSGIPGTVGGAIYGNAGAFGHEIKDVLISVSLMDKEGKVEKFKAEEFGFGYRSSGISSDQLIISAEIRLKKDKKEDVAARIEGFLKKKCEKQPFSEPSAGCVFKNPPGSSAGKLIDEAGCKGMRKGDVEVSSLHANFFVNKGRARASDFIRLMEEVSQRVKEKFGVILEPEIRIVGKD
ncbi:MAG: UDP-N-acetylmuramate dehydrogenase [Nitrospira sp.]|nr:UDP-N-acetylmuramate dehydrogenase [Nitrospira sp.]